MSVITMDEQKIVCTVSEGINRSEIETGKDGIRITAPNIRIRDGD